MSSFAFVKETADAWIYEGLAIPYGGVTKSGQDLTGSHFTKDTDLCLDWFPDGGRPILYRHGMPQDGPQTSPIGRETGFVKEDSRGRWYQFQIDKAKNYAAEVKQLADEGILALSSGAVDHLVSIAAKSGEIRRWPWVELSLIPNPAHPEALFYQVKSADAVEHLRIVGSATKDLEDRITIVETFEPEAAKDSGDDAATAAYTLASLISLLEAEADETAQAALIRTAIDAVQAFITAETAEIGTPEEAAEEVADDAEDTAIAALSTDRLAIREGRRNAASDQTTIQGIHDATRDLGADCAMGKSAPAAPRLVITGTPAVVAEDLSAVTDAMKAVAMEHARRLLGR